MTKFDVHGPFQVGGSGPEGQPSADLPALLYRPLQGRRRWRVPDRRQAKRWFSKVGATRLENRYGVYVFVKRWGPTPVPLYVGMTRAGRGFIQEATSLATLRWIVEGLNELGYQRAAIELYFITPRNHRRNPNVEKIQNLESFVIAAYHHFGDRLLNLNKRPRQPWVVVGWPLAWADNRDYVDNEAATAALTLYELSL